MTSHILHAESIGQGDVVVLVHGFLASSHYYKTMRRRLARDHQVITLDLLGFGRSPKPKTHVTYDMQVQAIYDTVRHLGIQTPFALIGHSMGALVSLRFANTYPQLVKSVQLFNPPIFTSTQQAREAFHRTGRHYRILLHSPRRHFYWAFIKLSPRNIFNLRPEINFADTLRASKHAREGGYQRVILAAELLADLDASTVPVLLVVGKYDRLVYQENLDGHQLPSNVSLRLVETGHHTIAKEPDLGESLVRKHL